MTETLHYNLIFRPELEGGFTVIVPSLPGCITYGKNLEEAKEMARDAIEGYTGSHFIFYDEENKKRVTVPYHTKDLPKGTILSILKQAGITQE